MGDRANPSPPPANGAPPVPPQGNGALPVPPQGNGAPPVPPQGNGAPPVPPQGNGAPPVPRVVRPVPLRAPSMHQSYQQALAELQRITSLRIVRPLPPPMMGPRNFGYLPGPVALHPRPTGPVPSGPRPNVSISSLGAPTYRGYVPQITGSPGNARFPNATGPLLFPGPSAVPGASEVPGPSSMPSRSQPPTLPHAAPSPRHGQVQHEHEAILEELSAFCREHTSPRAITIATDYMQQVKCLERRRDNALANGQADFMSQNHFDEQRLRLIREARHQIEQYRQHPDIDNNDGDDNESSSRKSNGRFSDRATLMLETWYAQHLTNPYISPREAESLGEKAGLTAKEVTKWMDNRRNRDKNNKKNGRSHPYDRKKK
jgi:hypothetical protein